MFVFKAQPTFIANVKIYAPTENGTKVAYQVKGIFKVLSPERVSELTSEALEKRAKGEDFADNALAILGEALFNWGDIKEDAKDGPDLEFTDESFRQIMALPYVRSGFIDAYFDAVNGKARKGN